MQGTTNAVFGGRYLEKVSTAVMVRSALLGVIAALLMQLSFTIPIFPGFLSLDVSDLPALVGAITTGPLTGLLVMLIKNLLDPILFGTTTGGIGNLANFVIGTALVVPIGLVFRMRRDSVGYIVGSVVGLLSMLLAAGLMNYFVLIPLFSRIFIPIETIIAIAASMPLPGSESIDSLLTLILLSIIPFNVVKGTLVIVLGYLLYRALKPFLPYLNVKAD
ncbi:MAG: ECF transporter S component [Turicibacter sp.]|nr:ECF transporter S component [Turicibacter sp.]